MGWYLLVALLIAVVALIFAIHSAVTITHSGFRNT